LFTAASAFPFILQITSAMDIPSFLLQETPIGEVIEGMENAEQFYSYGDMPPWGNGPVQGKIHGHPEYLEENFPELDKFVHCKVERLNVEQEKEVTNKADHKTDEEEFARVASEERELLQVQEPYRPHVGDQPGLPTGMDPLATYGGVAILAVMGIAMMLVKSRKKAESKTN
jgi:hypothetical protein